MYERTFGTDWETLEDRDDVVRRAFALGVAEQLGEECPEELERLTDQVETTYDRSFVEIAYQKGKEKASNTKPEVDSDERVWTELVEEKTTIDPTDPPEPTGHDETLGLPKPLHGIDFDAMHVDSTERVRRPSFLERQTPKPRSKPRSSGPGGRSRRDDETVDWSVDSTTNGTADDEGNETGNGDGASRRDG